MNSYRPQQDALPVRDSSHGARAVVVNRTHRVVREQALRMREQKEKSRNLWNGVPDASDQLLLFLLWSLPVTALVVGLVWFKRSRGRSGGEVSQ